MDTEKVNRWLTLGANLGVLAGIMLVAFEINQANLTTRAEMISGFQDRWIAMDMSWQDAEFAAAWAKAIENPEELSISEMIQVSGHIWAFLDQVNSSRRLWALGVAAEPMAPTEVIIAANAPIFFGNEFAQSWWAENKGRMNQDFVMLIDPVIQTIPPTRDLEHYDRIKTRIRD